MTSERPTLKPKTYRKQRNLVNCWTIFRKNFAMASCRNWLQLVIWAFWWWGFLFFGMEGAGMWLYWYLRGWERSDLIRWHSLSLLGIPIQWRFGYFIGTCSVIHMVWVILCKCLIGVSRAFIHLRNITFCLGCLQWCVHYRYGFYSMN